jgi:hypothetical protein
MFGKFKKILGIEGVKLELIVPEKVSKDAGIVTGIIRLTSLSDNNLLESIEVVMTEKYFRGKKENQLIDEYPMGKILVKKPVSISKDDVIEIPFELNFVYVKSEMDKIEEKNFFSKGMVRLAKKLRGVKSEYYIKADARIKGTTLSPFDKKPLQLV